MNCNKFFSVLLVFAGILCAVTVIAFGAVCSYYYIAPRERVASKVTDIAVGGGELVRHFRTIEEAMPTIHALCTPGTTVLLKASHSMGFAKIAKELEETYQ